MTRPKTFQARSGIPGAPAGAGPRMRGAAAPAHFLTDIALGILICLFVIGVMHARGAEAVWKQMAKNPNGLPAFVKVKKDGKTLVQFQQEWSGDVLTLDQGTGLARPGDFLFLVEQQPWPKELPPPMPNSKLKLEGYTNTVILRDTRAANFAKRVGGVFKHGRAVEVRP